MNPSMPVPDIRAAGFRGFGRAREQNTSLESQLPATLMGSNGVPADLHGVYQVRTQWNGQSEMTITEKGLDYKSAHLVPADVIILDERRACFTFFCPNQTTEWLQGVVGVVESFDVKFDAAGFEGAFRRQGEGILGTVASRVVSDEARAARLPVLMRTASKDSEVACPICFTEWDEQDTVQTQVECGHAFCLRCVVSTCNMTPPNSSGNCPLCRAAVTIGGLKRIVRGAEPQRHAGRQQPA